MEVIKLTSYENICIVRREWIRGLRAWLMEGFERVYSRSRKLGSWPTALRRA